MRSFRRFFIFAVCPTSWWWSATVDVLSAFDDTVLGASLSERIVVLVPDSAVWRILFTELSLPNLLRQPEIDQVASRSRSGEMPSRIHEAFVVDQVPPTV